jgi:hypothetical protein
MRRSPRIAMLTAAAAITTAGVAVAGSPTAVLAAGPAAGQAMAANAAHHDSAADHAWNSADVRAVQLTGNGATTTATGVTVSGSTVTVTAAGTYQFTGSLTNGRIVVNSTGTGIVRILLNGVTIANSTTSALHVAAASEVMVVVNAGTTNRLTDASTRATTDTSTAALFSEDNLTITGTGSLTVQGNAVDGIASEDGLVIDSVNLTVNAVDDAVRGQDYVVLNSGTVTATSSGGDGVKSNDDADATRGYVHVAGGSLSVTAAGDGVSATTDVVVSGGTVSARTGGGSTVPPPADGSSKGLKAGVLLALSDGQTTVDSSDDGIHSDAAIVVDGGTHTVATADDGVHAETTLNVVAGSVTVTRSYEGLEALKLTISGGSVNATSTDDALNASEEGVNESQVAPNAFITITGGQVVVSGGTDGIDSNGTLTISGGTVVTAGSPTRGGGEGGLDSNGALTFTGGTVLATGITASTSRLPTTGQGWVSYTFGANQPAGTIVHLVNSAGTQIAAYRSGKVFRGVLLSSSQIVRGQTYRIYTGGTVSGTPVGGLYMGGTVSGTQVGTAVAGG